MKLLLESWKRFIKENTARSIDILHGKPREEVINILENSKKFALLSDAGQFRKVFVPKDDSTIVIKLAREERFRAMNLKEIEAANSYPNLFPKVIDHDANGDWIAPERLEPVVKDDDFEKMISKNFPKIKKYIEANPDGMDTSGAAIFDHIIHAMMTGARKASKFGKKIYKHYVNNDYVQDNERAFYAKLHDYAMREGDELYKQIFDALLGLQMVVADLGAENIAVDKAGNFKIIDVSFGN